MNKLIIMNHSPTITIRFAESFSFKPLQESDLNLLCHWLSEPHVKEWWNDHLTDEEIKSEYKKRMGDTIVAPFIVCLDNRPIGYIQFYQADKVGDGWWPDEVEGTIGIDQFIGEKDLINRGIGTKMIRAFIDYLFHNPDIKKIITDVDPKNSRAIRCYEKVGFEFVKEIMTPDGLAYLMVIDKNKMLHSVSSPIRFEKATLQHQNIIFSWLSEPHMQEFWDNSQEHKDDILNFIHGRKQHYFYGTAQYWVGYIETHAFCFLLSDQMLKDQDDLSDLHRQYLSKKGHTIVLDFGIGNKSYLGKGLAAPTLKAFTEFYRNKIDSHADTFFIDPNTNNPRAFHVYEKAGFEMVGYYYAKQGFFKEEKSCLMVKNF
jgi:RimJ/RimL family protein N-acetyltransferase